MNTFVLDFLYFLETHSYILVFLGVWDLVWKGLALWKASQNRQRNWFILVLIINSVGILPILYIKFFQKTLKVLPRKKSTVSRKK